MTQIRVIPSEVEGSWKLSSGVPHIGLVSDVRKGDRYLVVHNIGSGAQVEDVLFAYELTGHYRFSAR